MKRKKWNELYNLAKKYYLNHGNLLIPNSYEINKAKLGRWIQNQRQSYKRNELSIERVQKLESIGMVWEVRISWEEIYNLAKNYYINHGNLLIPTNYETDGVNLGIWIQSQRQAYKKNKLSIDKIQKLESIKMVWDVNKRTWEDFYELAKSYYINHDNLLIPTNYEINSTKLGRWIHKQRKDYKNNKISTDRIKKLESIKMVWDVNKRTWEDFYEQAKSYYINHGNLLIPTNYEIEGVKLGRWINNQRQAYKNNMLSIKKIQKLESIGINWRLKETILSWDEVYNLAKNYYIKYGNLLIPQKYEINGVNLGNWITKQRHAYNNRTLSIKKIQKLELIGMIWDIQKKSSYIIINRLINNLKNLDKEYLLVVIDNIVDLYGNNAISSFLNLSIENNEYDIDEIKLTLKNNMGKDSYNILILYLFGANINDLSYLYNLNINDIEKIRLNGMKLILNDLKERDNKNIKKKS